MSELENPDIFEPAIKGRRKDKEEEDRRLFYVAMARAKEEIILYTQDGRESKFRVVYRGCPTIQNHR